MSWSWLIFIIVIALGNFLMIGAQLIGLANTPGVLFCGERAIERGRSKPLLGLVTSIIFQSVASLTLSALIITWVRYLTNDQSKFVFAWIIGGIAAVYPIWQAFRLSGHERMTERASYIAKGPTHSALPVALVVTIIGTLLFIFLPGFLNSIFYPLLIASGVVATAGILAMIFMFLDLKSADESQFTVGGAFPITDSDREVQGFAEDGDIHVIEHLQKMLAYQQLAMEKINDAFARVTGTGLPTNEALVRPTATLFDEASVEEHIMPALFRKAKILSTMESEHYSMARPNGELVRMAFDYFDNALEAMRARSDLQIHGYTEWLSGKSDHVDVTGEDSTEVQKMDKALISLNVAIQSLEISPERFMAILCLVFNEVRKSEKLHSLTLIEFSERYIGGLEGKPARFFSE